MARTLRSRARIRERPVEQDLERAAARIDVPDLGLDVAGEELDVARVVDRLSGEPELGLHARDARDDLREHEQAALLRVQDVAQQHTVQLPRNLDARGLGQRVVREIAAQQIAFAGHRRLRARMDLPPVDVLADAPRQAPVALVQALKLRIGAAVASLVQHVREQLEGLERAPRARRRSRAEGTRARRQPSERGPARAAAVFG
jgi:hypothetical protein